MTQVPPGASRIAMPSATECEIGDVRQRVGGDDRVRPGRAPATICRAAAASKNRQIVLTPSAPAACATLADGSTPRWRMPARADVTQQRAVVAADFDDERIARRQRRDDVAGHRGEVLLHPHRGGREKRIAIVEHPLALGCSTSCTSVQRGQHGGAQVEEVFAGELIRREESVGQRHAAEVDERFDARVADAAGWHPDHV